jgi:hypothetical protein
MEIASMKLVISPYVGVGPLRLGMNRDEVRAVLSSKVVEYQRGASPCKMDNFPEWHLQAGYRDNYICNAIEMSAGSNPVLHGLDLLSTNFPTLIKEFRQRDPDLELDAGSLISRKFGVSLYAPNQLAPPESAMVFERGYYD